MRRVLLMLAALVGLASISAAAYDPFSTANAVVLTAANASSSQVQWPGGMGVMTAVGTFGGATLSLQFVGPDGSTLVTAGAGTTMTAAGASVFYLPKCLVQLTITSAGSTSITASLARVPP